MIKLNNSKDCCGCSACSGACPRSCISIVTDSEGFYYPKINESVCIECNLCTKSCPIINNSKIEKEFPQFGYVVQHRDQKILKESTSGGAFTGFAEYVIGKGGVVVGAAFNDKMVVEHVIVDDVSDLFKFRNSKYVQSYINPSIFDQIKQILKEGRLVCFSGTACQIEGLLCFLGKDHPDNLLCVDVVCRAVPSPLIFQKYLEYQQVYQGERIKKVRFRDKFYGYHFSTLQMSFVNKSSEYHRGIESDPWLRAFFSGICNRPSCYACVFKKRYRSSDITIWDCFNYDSKFRSMLPNMGATNVLIHTPRGVELFDKVKPFFIVESVKVDEQVSTIKEMTNSTNSHPNRNIFFKDAVRLDGFTLFSTYFPITIKHSIMFYLRFIFIKLGVYNMVKKIVKHGKTVN